MMRTIGKMRMMMMLEIAKMRMMKSSMRRSGQGALASTLTRCGVFVGHDVHEPLPAPLHVTQLASQAPHDEALAA